MRNMLPLRQLVGRLDALSIDGALDASVAALAYDARRVVPGAVFFAVPGPGREDWQAIPRAIERGAAAIVCEQAGFVPYRATRIRVANCRHAMAAAGAAFYGHPSRQLQVIVLTGCSARGPVAQLLYQLFVAAGIPAGLISGLGCRVGERTLPAVTGEPEALDVQELLAGMHRAGCRACIVELPKRAIEQGCLAATEIKAIISTDLTRDPEAVKIGVSAADPRCRVGYAPFGPQDPSARRNGVWRLSDAVGRDAGNLRELNLRLDRPLQEPWPVRGVLRRLTPSASYLDASTPIGDLSLRLPLPGRWNAQAALAAAALGLAFEVPFRVISAALSGVCSVPGKLERVRTGQGFSVLVDACASKNDLTRSLRAVREFSSGRVLLLFGCGSQHAASERAECGEVAARESDLAVLTSDNPGWEPPEAISAQVASGYARVRRPSPRIIQDRGQAIREILSQARRGDCVLLAGKGHRTVQELGGCVLPFDDRVYARAALAAFDSRDESEEVVNS